MTCRRVMKFEYVTSREVDEDVNHLKTETSVVKGVPIEDSILTK